MGVNIQESYVFAGKTELVREFYKVIKRKTELVRDFYEIITPFDITEKTKGLAFDDLKKINERSARMQKALINLIEHHYPIDKEKTKDTQLGFDMCVGSARESGEFSAFDCSLYNRDSISAYFFKQLLEKYFPGVFMYYECRGNSAMFNHSVTNDREMRFFDSVEEGKLWLSGGRNEIGVLYDGFYTKEEIADSYRLFLGNTDIESEFLPVFCGDEPLREDQYEIDDVRIESAGEEPPAELCRKFLREKAVAENAPCGLKPGWQGKTPRKIDYEKYPGLKDCPHIIGTREEGSPYLYRAVAYAKEIHIPSCILDFDKKAFDFDVLYDSAHKLYDTDKGFTLFLTEEQAKKVSVKEIKAENFFESIKLKEVSSKEAAAVLDYLCAVEEGIKACNSEMKQIMKVAASDNLEGAEKNGKSG